MSDPEENRAALIEAGRYRRLAEARERGLVVAAADLPYWIERDGREWVLLVEPGAGADVARELAAYEREEQARPKAAEALPMEKPDTMSLYVVAFILGALFMVQQVMGPRCEDRGAAESSAILRGQWWRAVTALTLHADASHIGANLATGLLFAAFVLPRLGTGMTWLAILLSGAFGNVVNAWGYRGEWHGSIGASTACFGALGILMGVEMLARWREPQTRSRWQLVLPLGAGLGLLAFLGVGEKGAHVDYMAHCWGFAVGAVEGLVAEWFELRKRASAAVQRAAAWAAVGILALAWALAWR